MQISDRQIPEFRIRSCTATTSVLPGWEVLRRIFLGKIRTASQCVCVEQHLFGPQTHLTPGKYEDCATLLYSNKEYFYLHTIQVVISLDVLLKVSKRQQGGQR